MGVLSNDPVFETVLRPGGGVEWSTDTTGARWAKMRPFERPENGTYFETRIEIIFPDPPWPGSARRLGQQAAIIVGAGPHLKATPMPDVTRILSAIEQGDPSAAEQLLPLVYDELRKLAAAKMAQEKPGQTLQATALVHEAYLRLVDVEKAQHWDSRGHFFAAAAEAMRRILIHNAERKRSLKRGGDRTRIELSEVQPAIRPPEDDLLALNDALDELGGIEPETAELVKLRYFAGFTNKQAAEILGISPRKGDSIWAYAKVWLRWF